MVLWAKKGKPEFFFENLYAFGHVGSWLWKIFDLCWGVWDVLVVACELLIVACGI